MGNVVLPSPMRVWSATGEIALDAGTHDLDSLGAACRQAGGSLCSLGVDVWCRTVGHPVPGSWTEAQLHEDGAAEELVADIRQLVRTVASAESVLGDCMSWLNTVTRVVIPLRAPGDGTFRSGCEEDIPGMVFINTQAELQILEGIVHESAHRHLFMALAQGPLIDPDHDGRYLSPLRPDPRPLRGIMLAYHALAYIAALFTDVADIPQVTWAGLARELADTREKMGSAEATIAGARRHLTDWGRDFFDRTREVAAYASA